ncbi:DUF3939 domain-containing protein [Alkalicoccus chagannorensis]|uniref:DUF3939 domain-containing protein n=1 Tax=Alkalicoccus chagannorensis TaxID=427072 RepID=UPI00040AB590|nr:DUF3939 domain-containing protein [Alkalicoccus chagannorensis]
MWNKKKKRRRKEAEEPPQVIPSSEEDVRRAVNRCADELDSRLSLRTIILSDNQIDTDYLIPHLGGIPDKPWYMSKETFDIFDNEEEAKWVDRVQIACDQYFLEKGELPCMGTAQAYRISYFMLKDYLLGDPPVELYIDPKDRMVTHRRPAET